MSGPFDLRDARQKNADRWQHCIEHGFPVRNQNPAKTGPCWTAYGLGSIRGIGFTAEEAVDDAILKTKGLAR